MSDADDARRKVADLEARVAALERAARGDAARIEPTRLYEPEEVAALLGCGRTNVYNLMMAGHLARRAIGAGRKGFKVMGSDILVFLDSRKEGGPSPALRFRSARNP